MAAMLVALIAGACAAPAQAHHTPVGKATFPGSNIRCSSNQKTFLRKAWQEAYRYTVRAKALIDHIATESFTGVYAVKESADTGGSSAT